MIKPKTMTPAEEGTAFATKCERIFGESWRQDLRDLGLHYSTVMRYQKGEMKVPVPLKLLLAIFEKLPARLWRPVVFKGIKQRPYRGPGRPAADKE